MGCSDRRFGLRETDENPPEAIKLNRVTESQSDPCRSRIGFYRRQAHCVAHLGKAFTTTRYCRGDQSDKHACNQFGSVCFVAHKRIRSEETRFLVFHDRRLNARKRIRSPLVTPPCGHLFHAVATIAQTRRSVDPSFAPGPTSRRQVLWSVETLSLHRISCPEVRNQLNGTAF